MTEPTKRLRSVDTLRGITILSMIAFHTCWDLVYFNLGLEASFLNSRGAYIWQQSICYTFILLSGYCFSMGHHHIKRAAMSLGGGILITLVTLLLIYDERDVFGVLWMLGTSSFLMILLDRVFPKSKRGAAVGLAVSIVLFLLTRNINIGQLGFEGFKICNLPPELYKGYVMTFLGFTDPEFYSSDYFSLIPWFFLFTTGYFLHKMLKDTLFEKKLAVFGIRPLEFIGRHSFIIYMLHQVVIYGVTYLIFLCVR